MSHSVYIEFFEEEIEIENPESQDAWVNALTPLCEDFAQKHYTYRYYNHNQGDHSDETMKKVAEAVFIAIKEYRSSEVDESRGWNATWNGILNGCIGEALDDLFDDCDQHTALHEANFEDLYESIEQAMEAIDGPVCSAEGVYEALKDHTIEKMEELDSSTPDEFIGNSPIPFAFTPDFNPDNQSRDDIMLHKEPSDKVDPLVKRLLTLARINGQFLMDEAEVDFTDSKVLEQWDEITELSFIHPPAISEETLKSVMDNMYAYGLPLWVGTLTMREIMKANFKETVFLEGGMIGSHDFINGAGSMECVETFIMVSPDEYLTREVGYTVQQTYDPYRRTLESTVIENPLNVQRKHLSSDSERDLAPR